MPQLSKIPNGTASQGEVAVQLERTLSGCRHVAAQQGFQFLVYLLGMSVEEARANVRVVGKPTPALSNEEACRYIAETLRALRPLVRNSKLSTLAFMLERVQTEAEDAAKEGRCRQ